ncbi:unnamed protein product [Fraxinus pennsylvanica]|uniref:Copine C-terminal domain-containing protein n=1 Tax=Fraxinus pennsylvanica TaxID=56036 RepID=A0AAD2AFS7_9LAMI|nr:unnamed protein product [Fraxinus pennsylvanica]
MVAIKELKYPIHTPCLLLQIPVFVCERRGWLPPHAEAFTSLLCGGSASANWVKITALTTLLLKIIWRKSREGEETIQNSQIVSSSRIPKSSLQFHLAFKNSGIPSFIARSTKKNSGPTSFAPIIEMAMTVVEQSGGQYHVLLIIADGQLRALEDQLLQHQDYHQYVKCVVFG